MFAVMRTGGKQYRVEPGMLLDIEKIPGEVGETVQFPEVLLLAEGERVQVGQPLVQGVSVSGRIVDQKKGPKLLIFKKRRRQGYRKKTGHRQQLTRIEVQQIESAGC